MLEIIFDPSDAARGEAHEQSDIEQREVTTTVLPPFFTPVPPTLFTQPLTGAKGRSWNWYIILALVIGVVFGAGVIVLLLLHLIKL